MVNHSHMSAFDWVRETVSEIRTNGLTGVRTSLYELYIGLWRRIGMVLNRGEPIYGREWDVLVILDACRYDLFCELLDDEASYDLFDSVESFDSLGTDSGMWIDKNFTDTYHNEMAKTTMVTANPHSNELLPADHFLELDEVWRYGWDDSVNTIPARAVTDRAIHHGRKGNADRMIVHYMQPHYPFVDNPLGSGIDPELTGETNQVVWQQLRRGEVSVETVWESYKQNLRYVMDDVILLLENLDADRVVVSSDHGNAIGEWGIYGHPRYVPLSVLHEVPWCETSASDTGKYTPELTPETVDVNVEERLRQLGYH